MTTGALGFSMRCNGYFEAESAAEPPSPLLRFVAREAVEERRDAVVLQKRQQSVILLAEVDVIRRRWTSNDRSICYQ